MPENYPPFRLGTSLHNLGTFKGRLYHFYNIIDPRTLFTSKQRLEECVEMLAKFESKGKLDGVSDEELWKAQKIKQAIVHPDTGKVIPMPFRMSGFVPFGSPIVVGLLLPNQTMVSSVFWQWLNQSHNACVNYANRNASKHTPTSRYVGGYVGAVSSAVSIAVGLNLLIKRSSQMSPVRKVIVQKFVPFPAVVIASTCNIVLMRKNELQEGIEVKDQDGKVIGTSKKAAKQALLDTAFTRMFLPAPIFLLPPIIMTFLERTNLLKQRPRLHLPMNATVTTLTFAFSLPLALALFPQMASMEVSILEEELKDKCRYDVVYYNKGL